MPRSPGTGNALSTHHPREAARHTHHTTHPPSSLIPSAFVNSMFPDQGRHRFQVSRPIRVPIPGFPADPGTYSRFPDQGRRRFQVSRQKQAPYGRNRTGNLESKEESEESSLPHERHTPTNPGLGKGNEERPNGEPRKPLRGHSVKPLAWSLARQTPVSERWARRLRESPEPTLERRQALPSEDAQPRPRKITEPALVPFTSCDSARFCGARGGARPQAPSPRARRADCAATRK